MLNRFKASNIFSTILTVMIASGALVGILGLQLNSLQNQAARQSQLNYSQQEDWERAQLRTLAQAPTFGFDNFIADWAYYRFLQYFGDKPARRETGYSLLPNYLEVIAKKDPRFVSAFRYLSPVSSIYSGRPEETVHWLEYALQDISPEIPLSYTVWTYKAHDELLLLGKPEAAAHSYRMAAKWASINDDPNQQRSAQSLRQTAQFLEQNPTSPIPKIASWAMVLRQTSDSEIQKKAIAEIQKLGGQVRINNEGKVQIDFPQE